MRDGKCKEKGELGLKRKFFSVAAATLIAVGGLLGASMPGKVEASSLNQKLKEVQKKKSEVNADKKDTQSKLNANKAKQDETQQDIERLDIAVSKTATQVREKENQIAQTKTEIAKLKTEITELTASIEKRDNLLKERVRSVQQNGGTISYLDVLFGAKSFSDFIDRVSAVTTIVQQDKEILIKQENEKKLLVVKKEEVDKKLTTLESDKAELVKLQSQLKTQISQKEQLMTSLKQTEKVLEEEMMSLEEERKTLAAQEAATKELLRREEEQRKQQASRGDSSSGPMPALTGGTFIRPAVGPITSGFGKRNFGDGWHDGIDIGKRAASVPIVAVADGIVSRSYYSSSYGNVVFIVHRVSGQTWTTVSAHMENRLVSEGQFVKQGTVLGYMGNTGRSFGAHLHFELHRGSWNGSKSNAVNPAAYIPF